MFGARAVRINALGPDSVFGRIGAFLADQRLEPTPTNYALAHEVITDPAGTLSRAVLAITETGARLTEEDMEKLGFSSRPTGTLAEEREKADGLVARTQMQVEGFADMMEAMQVETRGFGRDLAASAAAIRDTRAEGGGAKATEKLSRLTAAMMNRVRAAETKLEAATHEANDLRRKLEEARANARRDPLTNLPNRRALEEAYLAQSQSGSELCVAVCDIDFFKSVNDRFGHAVGDRVLAVIGEALDRACPGQFVARYGGEEFAILFSGVTMRDASAMLEAARALVASKRYRVRGSDEPLGEVTISGGLAPARRGEPFAAVFQRADALLYRAKNEGRNCMRS